jgi:hypothetical protein
VAAAAEIGRYLNMSRYGASTATIRVKKLADFIEELYFKKFRKEKPDTTREMT